jgi:hypothetical protein
VGNTIKSVKNFLCLVAVVSMAVSTNASAKGGLGISPVCSRSSHPVGLPADSVPAVKLVAADSRSSQAITVLNIVYEIETNGVQSYATVTPNFDGYGLSLGVVQFNFGGMAQHTFKRVPKAIFDQTMPRWGNTFYKAVHAGSTTQAIAITTKMQDEVPGKNQRLGWVVKPEAEQELKTFLNTQESRNGQDASVSEIYAAGYSRAVQWANARESRIPSTREIASFVDNEVFSGGDLGGMWLPQAAAFRSSFPNDGDMVDFVAGWIASCPIKGPGFLYDAKYGAENAAAWRKKVPRGSSLPDEQALLFALGFLKALSADGPRLHPKNAGIFKSQVLQRRGIMALGVGTAAGRGWPKDAEISGRSKRKATKG